MRPRLHRLTRAGWLVMLCGTLASSLAWPAERTLDRQFEVGASAHLIVVADTGSIGVQGRDGHEVTVHIEAQGSQELIAHLDLSAGQNASGVSVKVRTNGHRRDWFGWFWGFGATGERVRLTIEVPRDCSVQLGTSGGYLDVRGLSASVHGSTSGGRISVADIVGNVEMHTSGGEIDAENLAGPVVLDTSGGRVSVLNATGELDAHTSGGGIRLENVDAKIRATTSGGSIRAVARANHGIYLGTSGGRVSLWLPAGVHASLDASTSGGRVRSELPLSRIEIAERQHLRGDLNGGGERVVLRTSGGGITIGELRP